MTEEFKPKMYYNDCKCGHDWLLHSNTKKSNFMLIIGLVSSIFAILVIPLSLTLDITSSFVYIIISLSCMIVFVWRWCTYIFSRDRICDCCTCNKFISEPRPYGVKKSHTLITENKTPLQSFGDVIRQ